MIAYYISGARGRRLAQGPEAHKATPQPDAPAYACLIHANTLLNYDFPALRHWHILFVATRKFTF